MDDVLQLKTRRLIYDAVRQNPGWSARDIQRLLGLGWGETSHHLNRMVQAGVLRRERAPKRDFYFPMDIPWDERRCLIFLRGENTRRILLTLLGSSGLRSVEIAERLRLGKSTVSFHLTRLVQGSLVLSSREDVNCRYQVAHPERVAGILANYRGSFREELASRFAEVWDALLPEE